MTAPDERAHDLVILEGEAGRLGSQANAEPRGSRDALHEHPPGAESTTAASRPKAAWVLPEDFISRCTSVLLLLCAYSVLCMFLPTALGIRANPAVLSTGGKPPWDLLFLYEYSLHVPSFVGALTPVLLLALLVALPFVDRNPSRDPRRRVLGLLLAGATVAAVLTLTLLGWGR